MNIEKDQTMINHGKKNAFTALFVLVLSAASTLAAAPRQERTFTEYGIVDASPHSGILIISDSTYHLTGQTKVYTLGGKLATTGELKPGAKVGFNMYGTRAQRYLSDIWILPPGFDLDSLADE